ncbi:SusC/RagA family TonB-linked outer membrane protein [Gynurincola endophyticus]|uniref:SusC/RagA family TonB-linked outer membrane protein n=1 Tax=Gynurincola endophyticus TaxID=2479004 RepID=UPI0013153870|nr:TonB-dependent receptor [Gynurincola endophyticus]
MFNVFFSPKIRTLAGMLLFSCIAALPVAAQQIQGQVLSASTQLPLQSATVRIKETGKTTLTDEKGYFTLTIQAATDKVIEVSMVGYQVFIDSINNKKDWIIRLSEEIQQMADVVVIGYGTRKKTDLTGAVSSVSGRQIAETPVTSMEQFLQGRAAGVQIVNASGAKPGGDIAVRIRGINSINGGSNPLYVIDGFPGVGDLSTINPGDIESIDILKDASATAIYGSRGANGVVIITTKRNAAKRFRAELNSYAGQQTASRKIDMLDATEFAQFVNDVRATDGLTPIFDNPAAFGKGTDWQQEIFRPANITNHQLSISNSNDKTQYNLSMNYFNQEGVVIGSGLQRGNLRLYLENKATDKLKFGVNFNLSETFHDQDDPGALTAALTISPIASPKDKYGNWLTNNELASFYGASFYSKGNPVALAESVTNQFKKTHAISSVYGEYEIIPNLKFRTMAGADISYGRYEYYQPKGTPGNGYVDNLGTASISTSRYLSWLNENTLSYSLQSDLHEGDVVAGITFQETYFNNVSATAKGFVDDHFKFNNLGLGQIQEPSASTSDKASLNSYFLRLNYQYDRKYLFTFTGRVDGSSRFGADNKYGFFPSASVAYRLSEENFIQNIPAISDLKLRVSYGITGNQEIGSYSSLAKLNGVYAVLGDERQVGIVPTSIANRNLRWERTGQFNAGIDAGFFNNRVLFTADYYYKKTTDLLLNAQIPYSSGYTSAITNAGAISNEGLELAVNAQAIQGKNFRWTTNFNISFNRNKVLDLGENNEIITNGYLFYFGSYSVARVGHPIGMFYSYQNAGIWQEGDDIKNSAQPGARPGDQKIVDVNNDGMINANDRTIIGNPHPDFIAGFSNDFSYKNFDLNILITGSYGNKILNEAYIDYKFPNGTTNITRDTYRNAWTPGNPTNTHTRMGADIAPLTSSMYLEDGSFLRIKNVTFGYNLPAKLLEKTKLNRLRVYATVQNLWTFTKYTGYDPEVNLFGLNPLLLGYDYSFYPQARTFLMGVSVSF